MLTVNVEVVYAYIHIKFIGKDELIFKCNEEDTKIQYKDKQLIVMFFKKPVIITEISNIDYYYIETKKERL